MSGLESASVTRRPTPVRGALRVVRGSALAVVSGVLAVAAHAVGGGMAPDLGLTVLLTAGVAAVGVALADRRRGLGVILPVLAAAQVASHVLLTLVGTGTGGGMSAPPVNPLVMTAAHAVAVVLTALLLAHADALVFRVAGALARLLPVCWTVPARVAHVAAPPLADAYDRALAVLLTLASPRRGPPVTA